MEIDYYTNKLRKQCGTAREMQKAFGTRAKKVSQRIDEILASPNLATLIQIPTANCHPLTGDKAGKWALDVSGNFRLIFEINHNPTPRKEDGGVETEKVTKILITDVKDYH